MKFKEGDKIQFIQDYDHGMDIFKFKKGTIYTVLDDNTSKDVGVNNINDATKAYVYCFYLLKKNLLKKSIQLKSNARKIITNG